MSLADDSSVSHAHLVILHQTIIGHARSIVPLTLTRATPQFTIPEEVKVVY